jgi:hypothetical protein
VVVERWGATFLESGSGLEPPSPVGDRCWDREQLITAGFTPARYSVRDFGVPRSIVAVVWHDMEGYLPGAIARWNSGAAGAHLCILQSGEVVLTCKLEDVAWHAGTSNDPHSDTYGRNAYWRSHNINPYSVGIELEGFSNKPFTPAQQAAIQRVADWLTEKYGILRKHTFDQITGHHAHSELSAMRSDPGPGFDWDWVGV